MKSTDCQRYETLALARAEGALPSVEDARFEEAHRVDCEACRQMAGAEALLRDSLASDDAPRDELARRRELDALLELADRATDLELDGAGNAATSRLRWGATALAVAAGLALAFYAGRSGVADQQEQAEVAGTARAEGARVITALGDVRGDERALREGQQIAEGQVLESGAGRLALKLDKRVSLMLGEQARIRPEALGGAEQRVALERGQLMVSVSKLPAGQRFVVNTRFGRVAVLGTVFAVSVGPDAAEVRVTEGRVLVSEPGRPSRTVGQGEVAVLGRAAIAAATATGAEVAAAVVASAAPAARKLAAASAGAPSDLEARADEPVPPARDLLNYARKLRLQREWFGAAAAYGELIERHPRSSEAAAAQVALGQVQLEHLESPVQALESFEAYLARGEGALAPEAAFGKAGALRVLLRRGDERAALKQFLENFPQAVQASQVRRRLEVLGDE